MDEINRSNATATFLDHRWFRWAAIAMAVLVVLSFVLPVLSPFFGSNVPDQVDPNAPVSLPDFVLPAAGGGSVRLAEQAMSYSTVILVFHRGYDCLACRAQLTELQSGYNDLRTLGAEILAISLDDQFDTQNLAQQLGIHFPMLYDETGIVASAYGIREQLTTDLNTALLILDRELQLITNPVGTVAEQLISIETILDVIQAANSRGNAEVTSS